MNALQSFRLIAFLEGTSFVILLFIAMPLKYLMDLPLAVRIVGGIHGLLFLLFVAALYRAALEHRWPVMRSLAAFGSSLVPFGMLLLDRSLKRDLQRDTTTSPQASGE